MTCDHIDCPIFYANAQNGLSLDGTDDFVQTTYSGVSGNATRTVEAWIKTTTNCDPENGGVQKVIADWGAFTTGARFTFNVLWAIHCISLPIEFIIQLLRKRI